MRSDNSCCVGFCWVEGLCPGAGGLPEGKAKGLVMGPALRRSALAPGGIGDAGLVVRSLRQGKLTLRSRLHYGSSEHEARIEHNNVEKRSPIVERRSGLGVVGRTQLEAISQARFRARWASSQK